ncbi:MAG: metal ABC transporter ATP-binding protein [Desulfobacterales bacterium]
MERNRNRPEPVIDIRGVWFSYNGQSVLEGVNLVVPRGDFLVLIGPNGGGKTTLLKLILGLLAPRRGEIAVLGTSPPRAAHRVGYVPQNVHVNKSFPICVHDVVRMGRLGAGGGRMRPGARREEEAAVRRAMEEMGVWELRRRRVGQLSGGQLQRAFIARALVSRPEILLLDEAMASIDAQGRAEFYDLLAELNRSVTIVAVTHDTMMLSPRVKSVACVNRRLHHHAGGEITPELLEAAYRCPVDLVAHGVPHRVFEVHREG